MNYKHDNYKLTHSLSSIKLAPTAFNDFSDETNCAEQWWKVHGQNYALALAISSLATVVTRNKNDRITTFKEK